MVELLIMAVNKHSPCPDKDKLCYEKGDIVAVMPGGHEWGRKECLPMFLVARADITPVEESKLLEMGYSPIKDALGDPIMNRRRNQFYDFDKYLGAERMKAIRESGWRMETIDKRNIEDKA